jgi:hypothetical protein
MKWVFLFGCYEEDEQINKKVKEMNIKYIL